MTQPPNPVPPRGARPQLFNAPDKPSGNAKRHADFGPSILATIDGGQARFAKPRSRLPGKRVLLVGMLALMIAAAYLGVRLNDSGAKTMPEVVAADASVSTSAKKVVEAASLPAPQASAPGAASIETVPLPVVAASSAALPASAVASGLSSIQRALEREEPAFVRSEKVAAKDAARSRSAAPSASAPARSNRATATRDSDTELLAAMLPHLKGNALVSPTSPAYEKSCGQFNGAAAADCRVKFCKDRQGTDAACPAAVAPGSR